MIIDIDSGKKLITPGIYMLKIDNNKISLEYFKDKYVMPPKVFGKSEKHAKFFWNAYMRGNVSLGIMTTGASGAGKTTLLEMLANLSVESNIPVIIINSNTKDEKLITYIQNLENVTIFLDEFGKKFRIDEQNKMLTMLSSSRSNKKFYLISENDKNLISSFIRGAPNRIKYWKEYFRVEEDVVTEMCDYHNIVGEFRDDLMDFYKKSTSITINHFNAIISEHEANPDFKLSDILEYVNVDSPYKNKEIRVVSVKEVDSKTGEETISEFRTETDFMTYSSFLAGQRDIWVYGVGKNSNSVRVNHKNITDILGNTMFAKVDKYIIELGIV